MFIRAKKIKGTPYAYLVRNEWTPQGSRQCVTKYLGRIVQPQRLPELTPPTLTTNLSESLKSIVKWELEQHGFVAQENTHRLNSIVCNVEQCFCVLGSKPVVLALNNGHLCNDTLHELLDFKPLHADIPEETNGRQLAFALVKAGMAVSEEVFVQLVDKAVQELDLEPLSNN